MMQKKIPDIICGMLIFLFVYAAISKLIDRQHFQAVLAQMLMIRNVADKECCQFYFGCFAGYRITCLRISVYARHQVIWIVCVFCATDLIDGIHRLYNLV